MTPPKSVDLRTIATALENVASDPGFKAVKNQILSEVHRNTGVDISGYVPSERDVAALLRSMSRASEPRSNHSGAEKNSECQVPENYFPVEQSHSENTHLQTSGHPEFVWLPSNGKNEASQAANIMARELFPNGTAHQDSLKLFCQDAEIGKMFQGEGQSGTGATLMLPKNQMKAMLLSVSVKLESPEFENAWTLIQTLVPIVMGGGEAADFHSEIQKFLQNSLPAGMDAAEFMGSILEAFNHSGLSSLPGMQDLLLTLVKESGLQTIAFENQFGNASFKMNPLLKDMALSGMPQLNGLNELLGCNIPQGLNQILQPLMRLLTGLFFLKTETPLPKFVPDEKIMSELAALFAAKAQAPKKEKDKRRKDSKGLFGSRTAQLPQAIQGQDREDEEESMQEAACF